MAVNNAFFKFWKYFGKQPANFKTYARPSSLLLAILVIILCLEKIEDDSQNDEQDNPITRIQTDKFVKKTSKIKNQIVNIINYIQGNYSFYNIDQIVRKHLFFQV